MKNFLHKFFFLACAFISCYIICVHFSGYYGVIATAAAVVIVLNILDWLQEIFTEKLYK